jgi:hypothetical protein
MVTTAQKSGRPRRKRVPVDLEMDDWHRLCHYAGKRSLAAVLRDLLEPSLLSLRLGRDPLLEHRRNAG